METIKEATTLLKEALGSTSKPLIVYDQRRSRCYAPELALINSLLSNSLLSITAMVVLIMVSTGIPGLCAADKAGYAGLEYFPSSQLSRIELDKFLRLKVGASGESGVKALLRLQEDLARKNVKTNSEIVPGEDGNFYICVDVIETGLSNVLPTRKLENPHHIVLKNEKPYQLLEELRARLSKLQDEGRAASEDYQNGIRFYSDVPATRIAERIVQEMQGQERGIYKILAVDPNGERRADGIELLNWTPPVQQNCHMLIYALDDSDIKVRAAAAKYLWSHLNAVDENFPYDELVEALSRQLSRPSYHDRVRAMAAMIALCKHDSDSITAIKTFSEGRLKEIAANTIIPNVKKQTEQLLAACANPPAIKRIRRPSAEELGPGF